MADARHQKSEEAGSSQEGGGKYFLSDKSDCSSVLLKGKTKSEDVTINRKSARNQDPVELTADQVKAAKSLEGVTLEKA